MSCSITAGEGIDIAISHFTIARREAFYITKLYGMHSENLYHVEV
jgi:hypothetical protein